MLEPETEVERVRMDAVARGASLHMMPGPIIGTHVSLESDTSSGGRARLTLAGRGEYEGGGLTLLSHATAEASLCVGSPLRCRDLADSAYLPRLVAATANETGSLASQAPAAEERGETLLLSAKRTALDGDLWLNGSISFSPAIELRGVPKGGAPDAQREQTLRCSRNIWRWCTS